MTGGKFLLQQSTGATVHVPDHAPLGSVKHMCAEMVGSWCGRAIVFPALSLSLGGGVMGCTQEGMLSRVFRGCLLKHRALGTCWDAQNSLHALTSGVDLGRVLATPTEAAQGRK